MKLADVQCQNFMTSSNIRRAINLIKMKNSEDEDRIPQRIMIDGMENLISFWINLEIWIVCSIGTVCHVFRKEMLML